MKYFSFEKFLSKLDNSRDTTGGGYFFPQGWRKEGNWRHPGSKLIFEDRTNMPSFRSLASSARFTSLAPALLPSVREVEAELQGIATLYFTESTSRAENYN